jgi:RNA polymerase sigma factor (sigma-70 family)
LSTSNNIEQNENGLLEKLRQGDENAFKELVEAYRNRIYHTVLNIVQDEDEADDTVQDVFIKVYESVNDFRGDSSLSTWIYRIAVRKALDTVRRRKTRNGLAKWLPWWMPVENKISGVNFYHPGVALEHKEKASVLFKAISNLPDKQKIAFTLIKVEKMTYQEAEEIMQQSVKAIESLVSRAKQNLQKELKEYYYEHGEK